MTNSAPPIHQVLCLLGPTASGKTQTVFKLMQDYPIKAISVDSVLVYKHLNIASGKPTSAELELYPHSLVDILELQQVYSAGKFIELLSFELEQCLKNQQIPLLVGGSMQYFWVIFNGFSNLPSQNNAIRSNLLNKLKTQGESSLYRELLQIDPIEAQKLNMKDHIRVIRALEIFMITGKQASALKQQRNLLTSYNFIPFACVPEKEINLTAIQNRLQNMVESGLRDEIEAISNWLNDYQNQHENVRLAWCNAVGYKQLINQHHNDGTWQKGIEQTLIATARLAKKQRTWIRSFQVERQTEDTNLMQQLIKQHLDQSE